MARYNFFPSNQKLLLEELAKDVLLEDLKQMLLIRNFEIRAESAYQHGHIGGFFHSYMGQEAIQVAAYRVFGKEHWYVTSYRCHALALLLGATPDALMAELYGKVTGNAQGRGGSMHFFTEKLLGGHGIVGGQIPIATGAAFTSKYLGKKDECTLCFLGDGAVAQGSFHESLNLAALWKLPCIYIIENNQWGMGTSATTAIAVDQIAERKAPGYNMKSYTFDGMDYFNCFAGFKFLKEEMSRTEEPILVEVVTERFRGHSISDPGLYRSKEDLHACMSKDPILILKNILIEKGFLTEDLYKIMDKQAKDCMVESMRFAEESPWPDPIHLEEDVFAP
ncbi:MAG: pyruvate dehydrogenase (acetyl-transferring) E1 component subunit alpha [Chlamydiales bacterium]|nr:pyruvate dehydrogenase (acetyl-transferring) E1 component subunit alpha [Chlamydiales bacterium]